MLRVRLAGISLSLRLSCACLLLPVVCDVGRLGGGKVHRLPPLTQRMSGLAAAPAAARLRVSLRFVPQEGRITQYNLSLSTSSTRAAASKYGGVLEEFFLPSACERRKRCDVSRVPNPLPANTSLTPRAYPICAGGS